MRFYGKKEVVQSIKCKGANNSHGKITISWWQIFFSQNKSTFIEGWIVRIFPQCDIKLYNKNDFLLIFAKGYNNSRGNCSSEMALQVTNVWIKMFSIEIISFRTDSTNVFQDGYICIK